MRTLQHEQVYLNESGNLAEAGVDGSRARRFILAGRTQEKEHLMREIQSSEVKAHLPQYLSAVERGETIVITRRGRPIAHLVPAPEQNRERVRKALDAIADLRRTVAPLSVEEILAARHEGHGY